MQIDPHYAILRLPKQETLDLFMLQRSRRTSMFRLLAEDGTYMRDGPDGSPITLKSWEDALHEAEANGATFIANFREGKVLCSLPVADGRKPCWMPIVVIPHGDFIALCAIYGREEAA